MATFERQKLNANNAHLLVSGFVKLVSMREDVPPCGQLAVVLRGVGLPETLEVVGAVSRISYLLCVGSNRQYTDVGRRDWCSAFSTKRALYEGRDNAPARIVSGNVVMNQTDLEHLSCSSPCTSMFILKPVS